MRRPAPRPLRTALDAALEKSRPAGPLASLQAAWAHVAGPTLAAETEIASERDGVLTVRCSSAVWAQELELMTPDLLERLGERVGDLGQPIVTGLRFRVSSGPN